LEAPVIKIMSKQQSDEFLSVMEKIVRFLNQHKKAVYGVVALSLLVAVGLMGLHYYNEKQKNIWANLLYETETMPTADALRQYETLVSRPGPAALKALLYLELGRHYQEKGKGEEAIRVYQKASETSFPLIRNLGVLALASSLEEQGKYLEAKDVYRRLQAQSKGVLTYLAKLGLIRVYVAMGRGEEANQFIKELQDKEAELPPEIKTALKERQALLLLQKLNK